MLRLGNEYYETARLVQMVEDEPRLPFINAVRKYDQESSDTEKAKLVEAIVRTSRTISEDRGALPDDIQSALVELIQQFRAFGPKVVVIPTTYAQARELIRVFFF